LSLVIKQQLTVELLRKTTIAWVLLAARLLALDLLDTDTLGMAEQTSLHVEDFDIENTIVKSFLLWRLG